MQKEVIEIQKIIMEEFIEKGLTLDEYNMEMKISDLSDKLNRGLDDRQKKLFDAINDLHYKVMQEREKCLVDFVLDFVRAVMGR